MAAQHTLSKTQLQALQEAIARREGQLRTDLPTSTVRVLEEQEYIAKDWAVLNVEKRFSLNEKRLNAVDAARDCIETDWPQALAHLQQAEACTRLLARESYWVTEKARKLVSRQTRKVAYGR